jgi:hypothetical protein
MTDHINTNINEIKSAIRFGASKSDPWAYIETHIKTSLEKPCTDMTMLKQNNTKTKGDMFECFCKLYLTHAYTYYTHVWLLNEVPTETLSLLGMRSNDVGIDLIAVDKFNNYYAVQCKYRKRLEKRKTFISWKQLSTFYAYASRTGVLDPNNNTRRWKKMIVMTNADGVRREGGKTDNDLSICYQTFKNTTNNIWLNILGSTGHTLGDATTNPIKTDMDTKTENTDAKMHERNEKNNTQTQELLNLQAQEIRLKRSKFLERLENKNITKQ